MIKFGITLTAQAVAIAVLFMPSLARADTNSDDSAVNLAVRGFGSLVATKTSDDKVGWRVQNQPIDQARQYAGKWAFNAESIIGLQADVNSYQDLSGTVQVLATNSSHGNIEPAVELAFLRYKIHPGWQIRLGKIWTPSFMNSETRYIGYSNTVFRNTNYTLYQITNLDGADVQYSQPVGTGNLKIAGYYGVNSYQLPNNPAGKDDYYNLPKIVGAYVSWENESLLIRTSFTRIILERLGAANTGILATTVPALRQAFANGSCSICGSEAEKWARVATGVQYDVFTMAGKYNWRNSAISAEYILRNTDATFPKAAGFDIEASSNFGRLTPYISYTSLISLSNNKAVFPASLTQFAGLNASYKAGEIDRKIITTGIKIDLAKNLSFRSEVMQLRFASPVAGVGFAPAAGGSKNLPSSYRVFSTSLDFLF